VNRRTYLATAVTAFGAGTAGCQSGQETTAEQQTPEATTTGPGETDSSGDVGLTIGTEAGIEVTYEDSLVTDTVVTSNDARQAEDGRRFVLLQLSVRNNTGDTTEFPGGERFELTAGNNAYRRTTVTDSGGFGTEAGRIQQPVLGDEYRTGGRVDAGAVTSGWLVVSVPVDGSEFTLELTEVTAESGETPSWSVVADATDLATCSVSVNGPQTVTQGTEATYTIIAENTGNRQVRCYRQLTASRGRREQTETLARVLEPSSTHETTLSFTPEGTGTVVVESAGESLTETPVELPTFEFGKSWTSPDGIRVNVTDVQFAQEATYEPEYEDEELSVESGPDSKFAFFYVTVAYTGNDSTTEFPKGRDIRVERKNGEIIAQFYGRDDDVPQRWTDPVSGDLYADTQSFYYSGDTASGWFVATVPESLSRDDLYLRITTSGVGSYSEMGGRWTGR